MRGRASAKLMALIPSSRALRARAERPNADISGRTKSSVALGCSRTVGRPDSIHVSPRQPCARALSRRRPLPPPLRRALHRSGVARTASRKLPGGSLPVRVPAAGRGPAPEHRRPGRLGRQGRRHGRGRAAGPALSGARGRLPLDCWHGWPRRPEPQPVGRSAGHALRCVATQRDRAADPGGTAAERAGSGGRRRPDRADAAGQPGQVQRRPRPAG